jgi:hypothetical protein
MQAKDKPFTGPIHCHAKRQSVGSDMAERQGWNTRAIRVDKAHAQKNRNCWSDLERLAMLTEMERPNWVYWPDQGKWRAHPEGFPDREIQAVSFEELQLKIDQLSQAVAISHREIPRIERLHANVATLAHGDAPGYVLSQEQGKWRGYLRSHPDHSVQGESFDEVQFKLYRLYCDLTRDKSSTIRKVA